MIDGYFVVPVGKLGKFGLGRLGLMPAGLGTLPGVASGMLGVVGLISGNLVVLPGFAVGLPMVGSIGLILELGEELVGLVGSLTGEADPLAGIRVFGCGAVASVAAGFFFITPEGTIFLPVTRGVLTFFFLRLILVWTARVLTWEGV